MNSILSRLWVVLSLFALVLGTGCEYDVEEDLIEPDDSPPTSPPELTVVYPTGDYYRMTTAQTSTAKARSSEKWRLGAAIVQDSYGEVYGENVIEPLQGSAYNNPNRLITTDFTLHFPGIYEVWFDFGIRTDYIDFYGDLVEVEVEAYAEAQFDVTVPTVSDPTPPPVGYRDLPPCYSDPEGEPCEDGGGGGGGGGGTPWAPPQYRPTPSDGPYFSAVGFGNTLSRWELRILALQQSPEALDEMAVFFDEVYDIDLYDVARSSPTSPLLDAASQLRPHAVAEDDSGIPRDDIPLTTLIDDIVSHYNSASSAGRPGSSSLTMLSRSGLLELESEKATSLDIKSTPSRGELRVNVYPNPSMGRVHTQFTLEEKMKVTLSILDLNGHLVYETSLEGRSGVNLHRWEGRSSGALVGPGTYIVRVEAGGHTATSKFVVL